MASVYQATDVALGRSVALKLFKVDAADPSETERQQAEVAVLASLNHFALVTLFDAGAAVIDGEERTYFVMEFVDGLDLRSRIAQGRLPAGEVAELGADLAEALHYVHSRGIIHRDIKPANILLAPSDFPGRSTHAKLADFGIARLLADTRLTATGALIGTASYLSPEQALGAAIGAPTDVYSLGLVLLECLTGERVFPGTAVESAMARLQRDPEMPPGLGPDWEDVLEAMTRREPGDRIGADEAAVRLRALVGADVALTPETELFSVPAGAQTIPIGTDAGDTVVPPRRPSGSSAVTPAALAYAQEADPDADEAPTAVLPLPSTSMPAKKAPARRPSQRPGLRLQVILWLVAAVLLAVSLVALALGLPAGSPASPAPSYPPVDGEIGTHLEQLQESVTP